MFFEKLINSDFEQFINQEVFSITNLENTSFATNKPSMYLIKTLCNGKLVRHYVDNFCWYDASDVDNVKDYSYNWQGFLLSKFEDTSLYNIYFEKLNEYYKQKYTYRKGKQVLIKVELVKASLDKVLNVSHNYSNSNVETMEYEKV